MGSGSATLRQGPGYPLDATQEEEDLRQWVGHTPAQEHQGQEDGQGSKEGRSPHGAWWQAQGFAFVKEFHLQPPTDAVESGRAQALHPARHHRWDRTALKIPVAATSLATCEMLAPCSG